MRNSNCMSSFPRNVCVKICVSEDDLARRLYTKHNGIIYSVSTQNFLKNWHFLLPDMHMRDMYSRHSSIVRTVCLNRWVFVYEINVCGFESRFCISLRFSLMKLLCFISSKRQFFVSSICFYSKDKTCHICL